MWAFYGYSDVYIYFLMVLDVGGALLLLLPRTHILGAVVLSGVLFNVIAQDIVYCVNHGALAAAIIYQTLLLVVFYLHRVKILAAIHLLLNPVRMVFPNRSFRWMVYTSGLFVLPWFNCLNTGYHTTSADLFYF